MSTVTVMLLKLSGVHDDVACNCGCRMRSDSKVGLQIYFFQNISFKIDELSNCNSYEKSTCKVYSSNIDSA